MYKDEFKAVVLMFINKPYRWGGDDPMIGFDCSGLVQEILAIIGLDPKGDQTAQGLYDYFLNAGLKKDLMQLQTGDLLFFGTDVKKITHVALAFDDETMVEAGGGGSKTIDLDSAISQNAYVRLRPKTLRKDLVGIIRPIGIPWR